MGFLKLEQKSKKKEILRVQCRGILDKIDIPYETNRKIEKMSKTAKFLQYILESKSTFKQ